MAIDGGGGLWQYRYLLRMWAMREVKVRYKQSVVGMAWAIIQPLVLMLMFTAVFSVVVRVPSDGLPYPVFSYAAVLPWTFLATSISMAVPSLVGNIALVTKIYFPREVLPIASVLASFVDFVVASSVFVVLMVYYGMPFHATLAWVPILVATQIALTLGLVLFGAALVVSYRDVRFIVPLGLQLWMYASPIIYPLSLVPERMLWLYMLNPMAGLIDSYRRVVLHGVGPDGGVLLRALVVSLSVAAAGYVYFKRSEPRFADVI